MKILYISPENTVGTLNLWQEAHEARGNECTFITLYPTKHDYDRGICLNLPLVKANPLYMKGRHQYYKLARGREGDYQEKNGYPPVWVPNSFLEKKYFQFRDWLWAFKVEQVIKEFNLLKYDIVHLDWGLEFYRDGRFVKTLVAAGVPIVCTYHGQDLRTRGVIPAIDAVLFSCHYLTNFVFDVIENPAEANLILSIAVSRELLRSKTISEEETQLQ